MSFGAASGAWANGLTFANLTLANQDTGAHTYNIQFDVTWANSWRDVGAPNGTVGDKNWDAAWLFAKFSKYSGGVWGPWTHCTLSATDGDHTAPAGSTINTGLTAGVGKGVFFYRSASGTGTFSNTGVKLKWLYGTDGVGDADRVKVKIFGIEMVYIPSGPFDIGDGDGAAQSTAAFQTGATLNKVHIDTSLVRHIRAGADSWADDAQLMSPGIGIKGDSGLDADDNNAVDNASFPTGYKAFYIMKYELSQGQWRDFLNSLTRAQQNARVFDPNNGGPDISGTSPEVTYVMAYSNTPDYRDGLAAPATFNITDPIVFGCDLNANGTFNESDDGEWLAQPDLNWGDGIAYADWAGLRPFSELEFEKAARGPLTAVKFEYAWRNTALSSNAYTLITAPVTTVGKFNEGISNPGSSTGNMASYETMWAIQGVVRGGVFAAGAATKNRQETGGSYYGVMELSGNLWERPVTVGNALGRAFDGHAGDGLLNANGDADETTWPAALTADGAGWRGGSWGNYSDIARVSDRSNAASADPSRYYFVGARLARTSP